MNVHYDDCNKIHVALYNMYQTVPTDLNKILLLLLLLCNLIWGTLKKTFNYLHNTALFVNRDTAILASLAGIFSKFARFMQSQIQFLLHYK